MTAANEDDWDTMEDAKMVVTDVGIVSKKEKAPPEYTVVSLAPGRDSYTLPYFVPHSLLLFSVTMLFTCR